MGSDSQDPRTELRRGASLLTDAEKALNDIETALRNLRRTWNTAEGRRGHIVSKRQELAQNAEQLEIEKEALRQEQWRLKKESTTLQHARDQAAALTAKLAELEEERNISQRAIRDILNKVKILSGELRR